jgi:hypothetical protein
MIRYILMISLLLLAAERFAYAHTMPESPVTVTIHTETQPVYPGDTLSVVLSVGTEIDFYYAGFELGFDSGTFFLLSVEATNLADPGVAFADLLSPGVIGGAVSRTTPLVSVGQGSFAVLRFVIDIASPPQTALFTLSQVELADRRGSPLPVLSSEALSVLIEEPVSDQPDPHWFDIAVWDLDGSLVPSRSQRVNAGSQLALYGASLNGFSTGFRGQAANSNSWMGGTTGGAFWEVRLSTRGFANLRLSSRQFGSGSGPRDFLIFGQVGDSGDWIRLTSDTIRVSSSSWNAAHVDALPLPEAFNDQGDIGIIWMLASEARIDNGLPMSSGAGTSRIDDIAVRGRQLDPVWVNVWPGDTNNDGLVNADDVLPLGTYWLHTGPLPARRDTLFSGRNVERWVPEQATYADTNGDGRVDYRDLKWIGMYFGQTRSLAREPAFVADNQGGSDVFLSIDFPGPVYSGDELTLVLDAENLKFQPAGVSWRIRFGGVESGNLKWSGMTIMDDWSMWSVTDSGESFDLVSPTVQSLVHSGYLQFFAEAGSDVVEGALVKVNSMANSGAGFTPVLPLEVRFRAESDMENGFAASLERLTVSDRNGVSRNMTQSASIKSGTEVSTPDVSLASLPSEVMLYPNTPNPFNPTTLLRYSLPEAMPVNLTVYDVTGRVVLQADLGLIGSGEHVYWIDGSGWSSGVYVYQLTAGTYVRYGKMLLVK